MSGCGLGRIVANHVWIRTLALRVGRRSLARRRKRLGRVVQTLAVPTQFVDHAGTAAS